VADLQELPEKCTSEIKELEEEQEDLVEGKKQAEKDCERVMEGIRSETKVSVNVAESAYLLNLLSLRRAEFTADVSSELHLCLWATPESCQ